MGEFILSDPKILTRIEACITAALILLSEHNTTVYTQHSQLCSKHLVMITSHSDAICGEGGVGEGDFCS